ncbi:SDR family NAD(P)-dependent oxidoreductase [Jannaschia seohaensis]|uniref:NAD(P)-dependent dehydrogenase (Short-subunit alcohol dehydrogenase family) n=1 Tax=Jannaschia seohaensis TaxID=475081 RepID=A0A2Y9AVN2_9RHOB|nr:SDR family oxidoreductase [Jannaschia seohaensis]PWJ17044.1 NAD(P)-dependent dehydrogenase (short-subunit alcohol dehydrogenase family) [Jannaschia seohaensis]SSA48381.1 NAD(P)-dependent dehydrogenase, short-chain alcohol dehydrogenase family [Jannaschia seohaensis]
MSANQDFKGRRVVVTGAAQGLGRAIADRFAAAGASILAIDLPDALEGCPEDWTPVPLDLLAADADTRLAEAAAAAGVVDTLVANAGMVPPWRGVTELDRDEWIRVMTLNSWAVAATLGAFVPNLERSTRASAILMASICGYKAHPKQVLYTASKHAVVGILRCAALDLGSKVIRVNALAPGPIATDALMARLATRHAEGGPSPEEALAAMAAETALGRMTTAEDVANTAYFLASDAAGAITGQLVPVEAGLA